MSYTTITTVKVTSLGPSQTASNSFDIPTRLETSLGQLSIAINIAAGAIVDLSDLLTPLLTEKYVGTIALQANAGFDVSLAIGASSVDIYSGVNSENYVRSINAGVSHVKVKAGPTAIELTGLITHGLVVTS